MDKRDIALQSSFPSVPIPRFGALRRPERCGERILVGANGTFLEIQRTWGYFIRQIGSFSVTTAIPYGQGCPTQVLEFDRLPRLLIDEFNRYAKENSHVEVGGAIFWNECTRTFRLAFSDSIEAGPGHLKYRHPDSAKGEHLIIDCHSHAAFPAFFSEQDNADDQHHVKFSYVVGNCNLNHTTHSLRLCLKGLYEPLPISFA